MGERIFVSTRKGLFTLDRSSNGAGPTWRITQATFLGDNVPIVLPTSGGLTVYAALAHGHFGDKIHRSRDAGKTWEELAVPEYPERPAGAEPEICQMSGREIPWKLKLIWSLETGGDDQPDVLWCGTLPGGLFRSTDAGESWTMIRSLWDRPERKQWFGGGFDWPGIHSIIVDPRDSSRVILGVSCGGVWVTTDGGETWNCRADGMRAAYMPPEQANDPGIQDPHRLAHCQSHPDVIWAQHHNGIFRTTDGCRSWHELQDVPPSSFGFAVAAHPDDPQSAWFVPGIKDEKRIPVDGKLVVTRTRDGGKSFDVLSDGLPQEHAYDIAFRHAMDIDPSGRCLVFGTSTGSLFISENQGDSWQCISTHLPPVYCTRFVE